MLLWVPAADDCAQAPHSCCLVNYLVLGIPACDANVAVATGRDPPFDLVCKPPLAQQAVASKSLVPLCYRAYAWVKHLHFCSTSDKSAP